MMFFDNAFMRIIGFIELGGPVVAILLVLSVISMAVVLFKFWQFARMGVGRRASISAGALGRTGKTGQTGKALALIGAEASRLRSLVLDGSRSRSDAEDAIATHGAAQLHRLQSGFRILDAIAQLAPLIGLFGTVLGMISAFQALQDAGAAVDPSVLAGGIWVALLTTAAGLAVAMPTSLALYWFESRTESHRIAIEELVTAYLNPAWGAFEAVTPNQDVPDQPIAMAASHAL